jgi:endogenous inhibitor of DNA gyrase (YacG/DUF329 family)|tara:strand:+ start:16517 stop:16651 length:135 start_codon:yes stop_codon:yes gene_type:complete
MRKCIACGEEIDEFDEEAIIDMPFAGELVSFCSEKCKEEDTKGL